MTHLVRVATDARYALNQEIKRLRRVSCFGQERHDEPSQTAVDVQADAVLDGQLAQRNDIVLAAVGEVDGGSDDHDSVAVAESEPLVRLQIKAMHDALHGPSNTLKVHLSCDRIHWDVVHFDAEIVAALVKCRMSTDGYDPTKRC